MTDVSGAGEEDPGPANLKLVRLHYAAFADGDLDGVLGTLDPNVTIRVHDEHGRHTQDPIRGRDGARAFFQGIEAAITNPMVQVDELTADANRVLARVHLAGTMRDTGVTGAIPAVHLFTVEDGLICEIRTHRPEWREFGSDAEIPDEI
jgi:ketosteroid isomerase-like protein